MPARRAFADRLIAVLLTVVMLHLSFATADAACARHAHRGGSGNAAAMTHHESGAPSGASALATSDVGGDSCAIPLTADCCAAAASCGVSFTAVRSRLAVTFDAGQALAVGDARAPGAVFASPDPPPPKA